MTEEQMLRDEQRAFYGHRWTQIALERKLIEKWMIHLARCEGHDFKELCAELGALSITEVPRLGALIWLSWVIVHTEDL